jgi:hypothetical protein
VRYKCKGQGLVMSLDGKRSSSAVPVYANPGPKMDIPKDVIPHPLVAKNNSILAVTIIKS